jgi:hypothetical protein
MHEHISKLKERESYLVVTGDDEAAIKTNVNIVAAIADHTDPSTIRVDSRGQAHNWVPNPRDANERKRTKSRFNHNHRVVWFIVEKKNSPKNLGWSSDGP